MENNLPLSMAPSLLQFPKRMLKPKRVFKNQKQYSSVILLKFPAEVLLIILKQSGLTVYDRASLALTCRMMAMIINGEPELLTIPRELAHGLEDEHRDIFIECYLPGHSATAEDIDTWATQRKQFDHDYRSRGDPYELVKFMLRLDEGWNRSADRYCRNCDKFVSVDEQYWHRKDIFFTYRSNSSIAQAWRKGQCTHYERIELGQDARKYTSRWIKGEINTAICPCCEVLTWQHCGECCDNRGFCCCCD